MAVIYAIVVSLIGSAPNMLRYRIRDGGMASVPLHCFNSRYSHYYEPGDEVQNYGLTRPDFWTCTLDRFSFWIAGKCCGRV